MAAKCPAISSGPTPRTAESWSRARNHSRRSCHDRCAPGSLSTADGRTEISSEGVAKFIVACVTFAVDPSCFLFPGERRIIKRREPKSKRYATRIASGVTNKHLGLQLAPRSSTHPYFAHRLRHPAVVEFLRTSRPEKTRRR